MTTEIHDSFFRLLRCSIYNKKAEIRYTLQENQWCEMMAFAKEHGVKHLLFDAISRLDSKQQPPPKLILKWYVQMVRAEEQYVKHVDTIEKLSILLMSHNLKMMVIKGYTLSKLYPVPEHRECGDIDVFLFDEYRKADNLIKELYGSVKIKKPRSKHTQFVFNGIGVDNHIRFVTDMGGLSPKLRLFYDRIEHIIQESIDNQEIEVMSIGDGIIYTLNPNINALYLLAHLFKHISVSATATRHLCDWVVFMNHYRDVLDRELLAGQIKECNLSLFVANVEAACMSKLNFNPFFDFGDEYVIYNDNRSIENIVMNFHSHTPRKGVTYAIKNSLRKIVASHRCYAAYLGLTNYLDYFLPSIYSRIKQLCHIN